MILINKIKRKITQKFNIKLTSEPFISGDTFRSLAKHIYEERNTNIKIEKIVEGDIVFVQSHLIEDFFKKVHPYIEKKYKLITHNGDTNITSSHLKYIDNKIIAWYTQNVDVLHEKIVPIPIGLENKNYFRCGIPSIYQKYLNNKPKVNKILVAFNIYTNPVEREEAFYYLSKLSNVTIIQEKISFEEYFKLLLQHKFVASPKGNGIDCHRTWEALYVNSIPITTTSEGLKSFDLPILTIDCWKDVSKIDLNLENIYSKFAKAQFNKNQLFFNYWQKRIIDGY